MQDRPKLTETQNYYLEVFYELSGSRNTSAVGAMGIPASEILAYCELFFINTKHERANLYRCLIRVDNLYLAHINKKSDKEGKASKTEPLPN